MLVRRFGAETFAGEHKNMNQQTPSPCYSTRLVSADKLRMHFDPPPSLRTIREWQARRVIPFYRIGVRVYFDPEAVREHLRRRNQVLPRN